ncbi:phosphoribosyltransferase-like protein [Ruminococcus albus]|uniref:PRTase-CE domain-containing protein n=1 Tax=Ruminococcus albus TaxID=1264 RepID=A0A1H7PJ18_RUMAL|nr:hypothetical protein [Ruminococcus albus]SEL35444.1 hypothetical protein SAMN05216469_1225 [Ruminococcus albus]
MSREQFSFKKNRIKQKKDKLSELTPDEVDKLTKLFEAKQWTINSKDDEDNLFDNFSTTLRMLDTEQRKLILDLTQKYICIEINEYYKRFVNAFDEYFSSKKSDGGEKIHIFILPLISKNDFGKIKSSDFLFYIIKCNLEKLSNRYKDIASLSLVEKTSYCDIDGEFLKQMQSENNYVCLIDDFMGSGDSAESAVRYLYESKNIPIDNIFVVIIAAMQQGIDHLQTLQIKAYCDTVCHKAITGTGYRETERIELMNSISNKIGSKEKEYLGYERSEALITLARTPNNTFPVYWLKKKNKHPPFPR